MNNIYVVRGTEQAGPFTEAEIRAQLASGELTGDSMVWWDGLAEWMPLSQTPLASPASAGIAPAAPVSSPAPMMSAPVEAVLSGTPRTSALAIVSLVSALVGLLCGLGAIVAVITGHMARGEMKRNPAVSGSGLALAGLSIGYIEIVLIVIFLVIYFALVGVAVSQGIKNANTGTTFLPTTNNAPANPGQ